MTSFLEAYIANAKDLAVRHGLSWDVPSDPLGSVPRAARWNLNELRGVTGTPVLMLSRLDLYRPALEPLNAFRELRGQPPLSPGRMRPAWEELYKAVVIDGLLVRKNKPGSVLDNVARYIRILAACADDLDPSGLNSDAVQLAFNVALGIGTSGKYAVNLETTVRTVFDEHHLSEHSPLAPYCAPYGDAAACKQFEAVGRLRKREKGHFNAETRAELAKRQDDDKLPGKEAFWELIRILSTERPRTLSDKIRFAHFKLAVITGLRVGELVRVPADWQRWREHLSDDGRSPAEFGGMSRSLMLRHFAEKQAVDEGPSGVVLVEAVQYVPDMFAEVVVEALEEVRLLTEPLRMRLQMQAETGRLFPDLSPEALVPDWEIYLRLSGSLRIGRADVPAELLARYRQSHDPALLDPIRDQQIASYYAHGPHRAIFDYFSRWCGRGALQVRTSIGRPTEVFRHARHWLRVSDVEAFARRHLPTKLPDVQPITLQSGEQQGPGAFLFLYPTRSLVEDRYGGLLDVGRYAFGGLGSESDLRSHLGGAADNIFSRYGETEGDKEHRINPHSLRHAQNTELFRQGVQDAIITKRFNRRSVQQSYVYDHRSLAEHLSSVDIPEPAAAKLGAKAAEALKLISSGRVVGPIVEEFRKIQHDFGDEAGFEYLNAEAGGLHVTPYGLCLNSFAVDPCPKHLECFNACRHLARTDQPSEQANLSTLRDRMNKIVVNLRSSGLGSPGARNQLAHAEARLAAIDRALATGPGQAVFPDGADLNSSAARATVLD